MKELFSQPIQAEDERNGHPAPTKDSSRPSSDTIMLSAPFSTHLPSPTLPEPTCISKGHKQSDVTSQAESLMLDMLAKMTSVLS